jgi:uncharacterized tellurite resistance protein B-like protein
MHILIGLISSIVALLYAFHRLAEMGIYLGGLNPFYWRRRRAWRKKYQGDPIYALEDPMEVAAAIVVGVAKLDGDISASEKAEAIAKFAQSFSLSDKDALQLFASSSHLLGQPQVIGTQIDGLLERHRKLFTAEQIDSLVAMITTVTSADGALTAEQESYVGKVRLCAGTPPPADGTWANKA